MRIAQECCRVRWRSFTWVDWDHYPAAATDGVIDFLVCTDFDACLDSWFPTNSKVHCADVEVDIRQMFFHN